MYDFLLYNLFSGLEFASVFLLVFSLFNIDYKYYLKESLFGTVLVTIVSYILVVFNLHIIVPAPLILTLCISLILKYVFKKKFKYAFCVSIGVSLLYGLIQWSIAGIAIAYQYIDASQINDPFSSHTFVMQTVCVIIASSIALFVKMTSGGFGFELRKGRDAAFISFVLLVFILSVLMSHTSIMLTDYEYYIVLISLICSTTMFFVLSHNRDNYEFTLN